MIQINVGRIPYEIILVDDYIETDDGAGVGGCDRDRQKILISKVSAPAKRESVLFHELAHAVKWEFDIFHSKTLGEEPLCNLMALAYQYMIWKEIELARQFVKWGIEPIDIVYIPGSNVAIPLFSTVNAPNDWPTF